MTLREMFEAEIAARGLIWCRECCVSSGHKRGFVLRGDKKTVHLDSEIATRSTLNRGLHEIAHCILDETGMRRFEKEQQANRWAANRMRELGVSVPRRIAVAGVRYVKRMKSWGDKIKNSR